MRYVLRMATDALGDISVGWIRSGPNQILCACSTIPAVRSCGPGKVARRVNNNILTLLTIRYCKNGLEVAKRGWGGGESVGTKLRVERLAKSCNLAHSALPYSKLLLSSPSPPSK